MVHDVRLGGSEKVFVERIKSLRINGPYFAALTREALRQKFGGGGDVLLDGIDQATLETPERFAAEMEKRFGSGSAQFYVTIVKLGESGLFRPSELLGLGSRDYPLIPSRGGPHVPLHDHRIEDEEGNYAEPSA